jgi:hypothetical protein
VVEGVGLQFFHFIRFYGEPRLRKPKELKGVKQSFSVDYIPKKCKCGAFLNGDDVWVKHRDYFSDTMSLPAEELGQSLGYLANKYCDTTKSNKFVYPDAWGSIVLRNEAWILLKDVLLDIRTGVFALDIVNNICRQQELACSFDEYELCCTPMERFWEKVIWQLKDLC